MAPVSLMLRLTVFTSTAPMFIFGLSSSDEQPINDNFSVEALVPKEGPRITVPIKKQYVPVVRNGTVIAYKTAYHGEVFLGNPKQAFRAVFDTGSGHLIIPSLGCKTDTCAKHRRFDSAASDTSVDILHNGNPIDPTASTRDQVGITFGSGKVQGEFIEDQACIGSFAAQGHDSTLVAASPSAKICIDLRVVMAIDMSPEPFAHFDFDGVLGLGLTPLTLKPEFSFFGQMTAQHPTMLPWFAVHLARNEQEGDSKIIFGGHDPERVGSEFQWAQVAMEHLGYWQVHIQSVRVGDTILEDCADGSCRAVLDTGTSLLGVPREASRNLHKLLARPVPDELVGEGGATDGVDCRTIAGKDFVFDLGGGLVITLHTEDYSRPGPVNVTVDDTTKPFCRSVLMPLDMKAPLGPNIFVLGEPVLRKYSTIYDWGQKRIGFAKATSVQRTSNADATNPSASASIGAPTGSLMVGAPLPSARNSGVDAATGVARTAPAAAVTWTSGACSFPFTRTCLKNLFAFMFT